MNTVTTHLSPRAQHLIQHVFELCAAPDFLLDTRTALDEAALPAAVTAHDTPVLVDWLLQAFSFQGIADSVPRAYMDGHGQASWSAVQAGLATDPSCPK